jgi:phosphate transport system ATP-binding protein
LDPISTSVIEDTIRSLVNDVTIVIVTHNMQQANRVSDNCALFLVDGEGQPGRIVEAGPTEKVFNDPVDPRTSDYVHGRFG